MRLFTMAALVALGGRLAMARAQEPAAAAAPPPAPAGVVQLAAQEPDMSVNMPSGKLLVRELLRQSILISARDQLGLATRDMTLREPFLEPTAAGPAVLDVKTARSVGKFVRLSVSKRGGEGHALYEEDIASPLTAQKDIDYLGSITACEARSRDQFVKLLRDGGFDGQAKAAHPETAVPEDVERQLRELNTFSQFAAVRQLHEIQSTSGESKQTLAALVRGYANLGQLTQFHWSATHKVYKARALLYAQRLIVSDGESPWSLWHRAYAFTLTGLHALALDDLATAERRGAEAAPEAAQVDPPAWVPWLDACCRYDTDRLRAAAKSETDFQQLAWVLTCLTVESSTQGENFALALSSEALESAPECLRLIDGMNNARGVGNLHVVTVLGPRTFAESLPRRLAEMPGLPADVPALLKGPQEPEADKLEEFAAQDILVLFQSHPALIARLLEIGQGDQDRGEPSWSALARIVEDVTFVQTVRRAQFFMQELSVPVDGFARHAARVLAAHPYRAFVETAAMDARRDGRRYWSPFKDLDLVDVEFPAMPLILRTQGSPYRDRIQGNKAYIAALDHGDNTARELDLCVFYMSNELKPEYVKFLMHASPHSPVAIATMVDFAPDKVQDRLAEWDRDCGQQPLVMGALYRYYKKADRKPEARAALDRYLERSKDRWAFEALADIYLAEGDVARWQATLDSFLEQPDFGLNHAQIRVKIANHFMEQKQWAKARPYAEAAAATGAEWALHGGARCAEGLGDFDTAESLIQVIATRYQGSQHKWFFWCQSTGRGDSQAARKLAVDYFESIAGRESAVDLCKLGVFNLLDGQSDKTVEACKKSLAKSFDPYCAIQLAIVYDDRGDFEARDKYLKGAVEMGTKRKSPDHVSIEVAGLLHRMFDETRFEVDEEQLKKILDKASPGEIVNANYFLGIIVARHGDAAKGRELLQRCADSPEVNSWTHSQARTYLRRTASPP